MTTAQIAGVDGCKAGWFVVHADRSLRRVDWFVAPAIDDAMQRLTRCDVVGIDIPIGLPEAGVRSCDRLARRLLSPHRHASVFSAPVRAVARLRNYDKACKRHESVDGRRLTRQAFHLLPKIDEVDRLVRSGRGQTLREVHPELAFMQLNDNEPLADAKRSPEGHDVRLRMLSRELERRVLASALDTFPRKQVAKDDVLDAFAVLLAARRIAGGAGRRVPTKPVLDRHGIDMAIWY